MLEPDIEARDWAEQLRLDDRSYREQVEWLFARSRFYREKLGRAGFDSPSSIGGLDDIARLPLTEKDEIRATRSATEPVGTHLCVGLNEAARIYSTSGTTGVPSYIPLTRDDLDIWVLTSARSYAASGITAGERVVTTYNAGPFVAGAALAAFDRLGLTHIPLGTGNTERLLAAIELLRPDAVVMTPSYALHLAERAAERGIDLQGSSVKQVLVAGEPGGGEPAMRARLQAAWGAQVTEAMGIGDISVSLWGECEEQCGMHLGGRGFVHAELIDPATGEAVAMRDGGSGELVLTHLRQRGVPLLRFRTRDHVRVWTGTCGCGRTAPRVQCIGRTDDMLIVRGVNVFPAALREVVNGFAPEVSGIIAVKPSEPGVKQTPPLPVAVELARGFDASPQLAARIAARVRDILTVAVRIDLVDWDSLPRSEYKSKLIQRMTATPGP